MDKDRIRGEGKLVEGSKKGALAKIGAKGKTDKVLGKGEGVIGGKKDKLANGFST
jgi:hypothetical protein